ncbi:histidine phosphatase family protein [Defluviimonas sp. WL0024]|uniref:Histidine phosphatase family protein n=1 Tax=Albidovulum salinarum TaxID=2984153 RepID=A0ABT2X380_9RHOB|nr:histidine phosphatase family protein [Defluviimonas sp. WL0024]MCU9848401.1 histidine phosphatase family protein [Defluviimonas sp. WL0024]
MTPAGHRRLILTRHAKSAWDDPALEDHDRPLNTRGRRAALELGEWLDSRGYEPDEVLCSTAARTRETWTKIAAAPLEVMPEVQYLRALYQASPVELVEALKGATGDCVMIIGHNPGIAAFAASLSARPPIDPDFARYPTAATLVVDFQIESWADVQPGSGSVLDFFVPSGRG